MTNSCGRTFTGKTRTVWAASKGAKAQRRKVSAFGALLSEQRNPMERSGFGVQGPEVGLRPSLRLGVFAFYLFTSSTRLPQFFLTSSPKKEMMTDDGRLVIAWEGT